MKFATIVLGILLSSSAMADQKVECHSDKAIQGRYDLDVNAKLSFDLERNGNKSVLKNVIGHIFVRSQFEESQDFSTANSYMSFFQTPKMIANAQYRPNRYVGYVQFPRLDSVHSTGLEDGMWGAFSLDLSSNSDKFQAVYIFKAGDHMGGTMFFSCVSRK